ncbi:dipeptide ABC transporter ATP-binding protein [Paenibacillus sp. GP183]|uniref:ABC transporter ATP-binding protein n=1 Tax=Paenibacillus sp. GP183 TaxID=1882751 RepID=UPI0025B75756|nr:dipeptide ABC transporter ATP-binding protein [Paenibacillus sp. GP183]
MMNLEKQNHTPTGEAADYLLEVRNVKMYFPITGGVLQRKIGEVKAVDNVSFGIKRGETLGLVGESGCGKSTTGRVIMRLYDPTEGTVIFDGHDITKIKGDRLRQMRQNFQMVFQDPYSSLNPRMTVGSIIAEPLQVNTKLSSGEIRERVANLINIVGLPPEAIMKNPHEFSGGQRQRIAIARALTLNPKLMVLDEAVSALDVSIQAQIINLLDDLREQFGLSYLFISHNLSIVKHVSNKVGVMYLGRMVEIAPRSQLYSTPLHPYTQSLLSAAPEANRKAKRERIVLTGEVPSPAKPPSGCAFHTRCPKAMDICREGRPELREIMPQQFVACHLY